MANWEIRPIAAGRLRVDPDIQRGLKPLRVQREAARFNPDALGVITVSDRGNGDLVIVDGQHRTEFAKVAEGPTYELTAKVFKGLSRQDEATLFRVLNNMEKVGVLDGFNARVIENNPVAVYLKKIIEATGWKIARNSGYARGNFSAVKALEDVYLLDPDSDPTAAERTLNTIVGAWGHADSAMDSRIVSGLGRLYARHKGQLDSAAMIDRLAKDERGPAQFIGAARGLRSLRKGHVGDAMAELFTEVYNRQRRDRNKLPDWR